MKKILVYILVCHFSLTGYSVVVSRQVSHSAIGSKQTAVVTINISKSGLDGIAKLIEEIPKGFRAFVINKGGGKVLLGDKGELKVIWLTLPVSDNVQVQYKLIHLGKVTGTFKIKGYFTFVQGDVKHEESISPTSLTVGSVQVKNEVVAKTSQSAIYKVQLGVFSSKKELSLFKGLPDIHFTKINGFHKYFSGKFGSEKEAKKVLVEAKSKGFPGAFLVRVKK